MKIFFFILIFIPQIALGQYNYDSYGHKINPARLPNEVENRTVRIGEMEIGERVQTFPEAMVVDDAGNCWLNPQYIAFPLKAKGDLEIIRNKLGYTVRVNYKYHQTEHGYSVPRWSKWERGYVPVGYIPIKSLVIDKPNYNKVPSQALTRSYVRQNNRVMHSNYGGRYGYGGDFVPNYNYGWGGSAWTAPNGTRVYTPSRW